MPPEVTAKVAERPAAVPVVFWLKVGKDVGVISYNESPMKKIILNGITTISTDFEMMGMKAAQLIIEKSTAHMPIPFSLTLRPSL